MSLTGSARFPLYVKSTLDFMASGLAADYDLGYFDLDGMAHVSDVMQSDEPALCWSIGSFVPDPVDPLYSLVFDIGGKTSKDPAQFVSMDIVSLVRTVFREHVGIPVMNYTAGIPPVTRLGEIFIINAGVMPAQNDRTAGLRLVNVLAKVQRFNAALNTHGV